MLKRSISEWLLVPALALALAGCEVECLTDSCQATGGSGGSATGGTGGGTSTGDTTSSTGGETGSGASTGSGSCAVVSFLPAAGSADFAVTGAPRIEWSMPVLETSLAASLTLTDSSGAAVPFDLTEDDAFSATLHPKPSLRIFETYTLSASSGVTAASGEPCAAAQATFVTGGPVSEGQPLLPAALESVTLLGNKALGIAGPYRGIQLYDLGANPVVLASALRVPESIRSLVLAGSSLAFSAAGYDGVVRFQQDPLARIDSLALSGAPLSARAYVTDVAPFLREGTWYVAVAAGTSGLHIFSAGTSGLGVFTDLGQVPACTGFVTSVDASADGGLIACGGTSTTAVLTSASPGNPASFQAASVPVAGADVRLDGQRLFIASGAAGLSHYDVANPAAPVLKSAVACGGGGVCDSVSALFSAGDDLFAVTSKRKAARFTVDPVSGAIALASSYAADVPAVLHSPVHGITADATRAFLATEEGVAIFARSAPSAPPIWTDRRGFGIAWDARRKGEYVYVASGMQGLLTFHWPHGGPPVRVAQDLSPGTNLDFAALALTLADSQLVLGDGRGGMATYDLTNPANPTRIGSTPEGDILGYAAIDQSTAYICNSNLGVQTVDISGPPAVLGTVSLPGVSPACYDLALVDTRLFVAGGSPNGGFFGVTDLSAPGSVAWTSFPEADVFRILAFAGGQFYATTVKADPSGIDGFSRRLANIHVPDAGAPSLGWLTDDVGARAVATAGGYLFLTRGNEGLQTFQLGAQGSPAPLGIQPTAGFADIVRFDGDGVLVIGRNGGVERFVTGTLAL